MRMDVSDRRLEADVRGELARDPRIDDPYAIAVRVQGGFVILRGTVASPRQQQSAVRAAKRCRGVSGVGDLLEVVRVGAGSRRRDAELRGAALHRLLDEPGLAADWLDVRVSDGWVTLKGHVEHQHQSDAAHGAIAGLRGIKGMTNEIVVSAPRPQEHDERRAS